MILKKRPFYFLRYSFSFQLQFRHQPNFIKPKVMFDFYLARLNDYLRFARKIVDKTAYF